MLTQHPQHDFAFKEPCKKNQFAVDNNVLVKPNGCGSGGLQSKVAKIIGPYTNTFRSCCDVHDICFGTCSYPNYVETFKQCNNDFKKCMLKRCKDKAKKKNKIVRWAYKKACQGSAYTYYGLVASAGKHFFSNSQK